MARNNLVSANITNCIHVQRFKLGAGFQTLGGTLTMDEDMSPALTLDPGGSTRVVLLPPELEGLCFFITNAADAAEDLTVKEDSATTTIVTISQAESALLVCGIGLAGVLTWAGGVLKAT